MGFARRAVYTAHPMPQTPRVPGTLLPLLALLLAGTALADAPGRLVHRYLEVAVSPDAARVASVEGDAPEGASYPDLRELVIRRSDGAGEVRIALPCGRVPQCWPGSPVWAPDGKQLSFTVRTPGSHDYALYAVAADGGGLTRQLEFHGTLDELRYSRDGALAMLAVENARKEVGATEAGAPVAGDLGAASPEQRIAVLVGGALRWASPPNLFVYEYDWRPGGAGFIGTAAPGDGDNNWWTAKLYAFAADGTAQVLYSPATAQQQIASPRVSPDGRTVAFIAGLMSDFGSTGGDVYSLGLGASVAVNLTPDIKASATALGWSCSGQLQARLLAGDQTQIVSLGSGRAAARAQLLWSAAETLHGEEPAGAAACPGEVRAVAHESFTAPPEIAVGPVGHWRDLTHVNGGLALAGRVSSISWVSDGLSVQGWLLLPQKITGKVPLVTIVHGGPAAAAVPHFEGPGLAAQMLSRGWAVFRPNPRGSFGQGDAFTRAHARRAGEHPYCGPILASRLHRR